MLINQIGKDPHSKKAVGHQDNVGGNAKDKSEHNLSNQADQQAGAGKENLRSSDIPASGRDSKFSSSAS